MTCTIIVFVHLSYNSYDKNIHKYNEHFAMNINNSGIADKCK